VPHIAEVTAEILRDEREMADWLSGQLGKVVRNTMAKIEAKP
jgi:hypothetical protein